MAELRELLYPRLPLPQAGEGAPAQVGPAGRDAQAMEMVGREVVKPLVRLRPSPEYRAGEPVIALQQLERHPVPELLRPRSAGIPEPVQLYAVADRRVEGAAGALGSLVPVLENMVDHAFHVPRLESESEGAQGNIVAICGGHCHPLSRESWLHESYSLRRQTRKP